MNEDLKRAADESGRAPAPLCPNLIVHRSNPRVPDDLAAVLRHRAEMVITSVGSPEPARVLSLSFWKSARLAKLAVPSERLKS